MIIDEILRSSIESGPDPMLELTSVLSVSYITIINCETFQTRQDEILKNMEQYERLINVLIFYKCKNNM